eukprot:420995-Amphidinium_carterae.2
MHHNAMLGWSWLRVVSCGTFFGWSSLELGGVFRVILHERGGKAFLSGDDNSAPSFSSRSTLFKCSVVMPLEPWVLRHQLDKSSSEPVTDQPLADSTALHGSPPAIRL